MESISKKQMKLPTTASYGVFFAILDKKFRPDPKLKLMDQIS